MNVYTSADWRDLNAYERANEWKAPVAKDQYGHSPGLYFWGSLDEEWTNVDGRYEYKRDLFRCTDYAVALKLLDAGFAFIGKFDEEGKIVWLLMKRIY